MGKRPNPAIAGLDRDITLAEDMLKLADKTMPSVSSIPAALRREITRKRRTSAKMKKEHPFLISNEGS